MLLTKSLKSKKSPWIESSLTDEYAMTFHVSTFTSRRLSVSMELAISEVVQNASGKKIGLFLSGGIDSCVIAHYMREMRVDFVPVIIRYDHDLNVTDVNNAIHDAKST